VDLDHDFSFEVAAGVEVQIGVSGASEAKFARMRTPAERIDRPPEGHPARLRHPIQDRLRLDFVEPRLDPARSLEMAHRGLVPVTRQPGALVLIVEQVVPPHRTYARKTPRRAPPAAMTREVIALPPR